MGKPEGIVEDYLIKKCNEHGCLHYKFSSPGRRGVPDQIVIGFGRVVFVELKSDTGTPSKLQIRTMERMRAAGADVRLYRSKPEIDEFFAELVAAEPGPNGTRARPKDAGT